MNERKTPETDAMVFDAIVPHATGDWHVKAIRYDFACNLERENAALREELAQLREEVESAKYRAVKYQVERNTLVVENSNLRAEVEGMRENDARYRQVQRMIRVGTDAATGRRLLRIEIEPPGVDLLKGSIVGHLDAAIDAARKDAK
tara:strand:+ start:1310 stop:1750 length:441 start_codon:yes stop_codon:yes gene_type:complete